MLSFWHPPSTFKRAASEISLLLPVILEAWGTHARVCDLLRHSVCVCVRVPKLLLCFAEKGRKTLHACFSRFTVAAISDC